MPAYHEHSLCHCIGNTRSHVCLSLAREGRCRVWWFRPRRAPARVAACRANMGGDPGGLGSQNPLDFLSPISFVWGIYCFASVNPFQDPPPSPPRVERRFPSLHGNRYFGHQRGVPTPAMERSHVNAAAYHFSSPVFVDDRLMHTKFVEAGPYALEGLSAGAGTTQQASLVQQRTAEAPGRALTTHQLRNLGRLSSARAILSQQLAQEYGLR